MKMRDKKRRIFNIWFAYYKDKKVTRRMSSNRDEAFYRGYKNMRLSNNRKPYHRDSLLRVVYNAGQAVRKHHDTNKNKIESEDMSKKVH